MKRMTICAMLAALLLLSACSAQPKAVDAGALARDLVENVPFQDELNPVDGDIAAMLYDISGAEEAYVYVSSGATAEEVAVFTFPNEGAAEAALEKAEARITAQEESYALYIPQEVPRLENAVVRRVGCCVIVCVSDGDTAKEIIATYVD